MKLDNRTLVHNIKALMRLDDFNKLIMTWFQTLTTHHKVKILNTYLSKIDIKGFDQFSPGLIYDIESHLPAFINRSEYKIMIDDPDLFKSSGLFTYTKEELDDEPVYRVDSVSSIDLYKAFESLLDSLNFEDINTFDDLLIFIINNARITCTECHRTYKISSFIYNSKVNNVCMHCDELLLITNKTYKSLLSWLNYVETKNLSIDKSIISSAISEIKRVSDTLGGTDND